MVSRDLGTCPSPGCHLELTETRNLSYITTLSLSFFGDLLAPILLARYQRHLLCPYWLLFHGLRPISLSR